jgi:hypothetical protein
MPLDGLPNHFLVLANDTHLDYLCMYVDTLQSCSKQWASLMGLTMTKANEYLIRL